MEAVTVFFRGTNAPASLSEKYAIFSERVLLTGAKFLETFLTKFPGAFLNKELALLAFPIANGAANPAAKFIASLI